MDSLEALRSLGSGGDMSFPSSSGESVDSLGALQYLGGELAPPPPPPPAPWVPDPERYLRIQEAARGTTETSPGWGPAATEAGRKFLPLPQQRRVEAGWDVLSQPEIFAGGAKEAAARQLSPQAAARAALIGEEVLRRRAASEQDIAAAEASARRMTTYDPGVTAPPEPIEPTYPVPSQDWATALGEAEKAGVSRESIRRAAIAAAREELVKQAETQAMVSGLTLGASELAPGGQVPPELREEPSVAEAQAGGEIISSLPAFLATEELAYKGLQPALARMFPGLGKGFLAGAARLAAQEASLPMTGAVKGLGEAARGEPMSRVGERALQYTEEGWLPTAIIGSMMPALGHVQDIAGRAPAAARGPVAAESIVRPQLPPGENPLAALPPPSEMRALPMRARPIAALPGPVAMPEPSDATLTEALGQWFRPSEQLEREVRVAEDQRTLADVEAWFRARETPLPHELHPGEAEALAAVRRSLEPVAPNATERGFELLPDVPRAEAPVRMEQPTAAQMREYEAWFAKQAEARQAAADALPPVEIPGAAPETVAAAQVEPPRVPMAESPAISSVRPEALAPLPAGVLGHTPDQVLEGWARAAAAAPAEGRQVVALDMTDFSRYVWQDGQLLRETFSKKGQTVLTPVTNAGLQDIAGSIENGLFHIDIRPQGSTFPGEALHMSTGRSLALPSPGSVAAEVHAAHPSLPAQIPGAVRSAIPEASPAAQKAVLEAVHETLDAPSKLKEGANIVGAGAAMLLAPKVLAAAGFGFRKDETTGQWTWDPVTGAATLAFLSPAIVRRIRARIPAGEEGARLAGALDSVADVIEHGEPDAKSFLMKTVPAARMGDAINAQPGLRTALLGIVKQLTEGERLKMGVHITQGSDGAERIAFRPNKLEEAFPRMGRTIAQRLVDSVDPEEVEGFRRAVRSSRLDAEATGGAQKDSSKVPSEWLMDGTGSVYPRPANLTEATGWKNPGRRSMYFSEFRSLDAKTVDKMNRGGGLRIQSFGDYEPHQVQPLTDMLTDAAEAGLDTMVVTRQKEMVDFIRNLKEAAPGKFDRVRVEVPVDYLWEILPRDEALVQHLREDPAVRFREVPSGDGSTVQAFKRSWSPDDFNSADPWLNSRAVVTNSDELLAALRDPRIHSLSLFNGKGRTDRLNSVTRPRLWSELEGGILSRIEEGDEWKALAPYLKAHPDEAKSLTEAYRAKVLDEPAVTAEHGAIGNEAIEPLTRGDDLAALDGGIPPFAPEDLLRPPSMAKKKRGKGVVLSAGLSPTTAPRAVGALVGGYLAGNTGDGEFDSQRALLGAVAGWMSPELRALGKRAWEKLPASIPFRFHENDATFVDFGRYGVGKFFLAEKYGSPPEVQAAFRKYADKEGLYQNVRKLLGEYLFHGAPDPAASPWSRIRRYFFPGYLTRPERRQMQSILHGLSTAPTAGARPEMVRAVQFARDALDQLHEDVHNVSLINDATYQAMKGKYSTRMGWRQELDAIDEWHLKRLLKQVGPDMEREIQQSLARRRAGANRSMVDVEQWYNEDRFKKRTLTADEREALLGIMDVLEPHIVVPKGYYQAGHAAAFRQLTKDLAGIPGLVADIDAGAASIAAGPMAGMEYRRLPHSGQLGDLSGRMVPQYLYDELMRLKNGDWVEQFQKTDVVRLYQKFILAPWKAGKVLWSSATQAANLAWGFIVNDIGGMPVWRMDHYGRAAAGLYKGIDEVKLGGRPVNLIKEAQDGGLFQAGWSRTEMQRIEEALRAAEGKAEGYNPLLEAARRTLKLPGVTYQALEDFLRYSKYRWNRTKLGLSPKDAIADTEYWCVNYSEQPQYTRFMRSLPLAGSPFITYFYDILPKMGRAMFGFGPRGFDPMVAFRIWKYPLMLGALEEYARRKTGMSDPEYKQLVRSRKSVTNALHLKVLLPAKDEWGNYQVWDTTRALPFAAIQEQLGTVGVPAYLAPFQDPFGKQGYEQAANWSTFKNKPIVPSYALGSWLKEAPYRAAYAWETAAPANPLVPYSSQQKRLIAAFEGKPYGAAQAPQGKVAAVARVVGGVRVDPWNPKEEAKWSFLRHKKTDDDIKREAGKIIDSARRGAISQVQAARQLERLAREREENVQRMNWEVPTK